MAVPSIRSVSAANYEAAAGTSSTITAPSTIVDGDLLLFHGIVDGSVTPSMSGFSGITGSPNDEGSVTSVVLTKTASSESGNYTFTHGGNEYGAGKMWAISGWHSIGNSSTNTGNATSCVCTGINTSADDSMVFALHGNDRERDTPSQSDGWTDNGAGVGGGANGLGWAAAYDTFASASTATGNVTFSIGATADGFANWQVEVRSEAPPTSDAVIAIQADYMQRQARS